MANQFTSEGLELVKNMWNEFWDEERKHFRAKVKSAETVSDWNGYTCWPYVIALEAILEAERAAPGKFRDESLEALIGLERYYSPEHKAYCAWVWFPGNGDIYLDDNAQVAILLASAHRLLPPPQTNGGLPYGSFLSRAKQIVSFCASGWDEKNGGGIRWHISTQGSPRTDRNACSTSLTAVAALEIAKIEKAEGRTEKEFQDLVELGRKCLRWVVDELVEKASGGNVDYWLVRDGLTQDVDGGPWKVNKTTYTYNTGHTITGFVLLRDLVSNSNEKNMANTTATRLVASSINRAHSLYDLTVSNATHRYWWDNNFFVHLLVEGLVTWGENLGSDNQSSLWEKVSEEVEREMAYAISYLKDQGDQLYFRNFRLYTITEKNLMVYKVITGDDERKPRYDSAERVMDENSMKLPVEQRHTNKTLLGCGGAARALLIAGRIGNSVL